MSQPNALAAQRRKARHYGLQALYQWTLSGASATDIEAEFRVDNDFQHTDGEYFSAVLKGVGKTSRPSKPCSRLPLIASLKSSTRSREICCAWAPLN